MWLQYIVLEGFYWYEINDLCGFWIYGLTSLIGILFPVMLAYWYNGAKVNATGWVLCDEDCEIDSSRQIIY